MADGILADPQDAGTGGGWGAGLGGAPLDPETQRALMMQVGLPAMLAQAGAALMARSQRGLTPAQMAHYGMQLGLAPQAATEAMAAAQQGQQQAIGRKLQMNQLSLQSRELESRIRERETNAAQWAVPTGGAPGATGAPRALPGFSINATGAPAREGGVGFTDAGLRTLFGAEGGNDANARSRTSSAGGLAQFTEPTWLDFARANPDQFQGMNRDQILAARFGETGTRLMPVATNWLAARNAPALQQAGLPVNDATLAVAHQFPALAPRLIRAALENPNTPVEQIVTPQMVEANRTQLAGKTVGQVVGAIMSRYGGAARNDAAPADGAAVPPAVARLRAMGVPDARIAAIAALPADKRDAAVAELATRASTERNQQFVTGQDGTVYLVTPQGLQVAVPNRPDPGGVPTEVARREDDLRGQFQALAPVTRYSASLPLYESVTGALDRIAAGRRSGQDDQLAAHDAVVAYANLLDPPSVVREGEVVSVLRARGTPDYIISQVERVLGGQPMTPELARQLERSAADRMAGYRRAIEPIAAQYRGIATRRGVSPENVVLEMSDPVAARTERRAESHRVGAAAIRAAFPDNATARIAAAIAEGIPEAMVR